MKRADSGADTPDPGEAVPPEALSKQLEDEGYALVPRVLEPEQVEELRSVLTRLFAEPSPYPGGSRAA